MAKKTKNNYLDNKKFYATIIDYKKRVKEAELTGKPKPEIPNYAAECILKIAKNMATQYHKFSRYSYNDEMIGDAVLTCVKYFDNFDPDKWNNPHAYFTTICYQSNVQRIKEEHKTQYVKYKSFTDDISGLGNSMEIIMQNDASADAGEIYNNISTFIDDFEKKDNERKIKRKQKIQEKKMRDSLERFYKDDEENSK